MCWCLLHLFLCQMEPKLSSILLLYWTAYSLKIDNFLYSLKIDWNWLLMHCTQFIWCLKYLLRLQSNLQYKVINPSIYSLIRLLKNWYLLFAMELKIIMYYLVLLVSIVLSKNIICYYFIWVYNRVILHMMFIEFKLFCFFHCLWLHTTPSRILLSHIFYF